MMEVNKRELVCSVAVITYNHEAYVKECIESILDQNLNCELEVIIADDHSTDNTVKVIEEVLKSHQRSSCVKLLVQPKNIGMTNNFTFSLSQCTGKYIALLEGDDYWTDKFKLQKQVDFLESNPDCVACHHWHEYAVKKNGTYVSVPAPTENVGYCTQEKTTIEDIFANKVRIKTRTHTFRNVIGEMPKWFNTIAYGDVAVSMILGQYGKFGFINEPMAVYRITGEGVSANGSGSFLYTYNHFIKWIHLWETALKYYDHKYLTEGEKTIQGFYKIILDKYGWNVKILFRLLKYARSESSLPSNVRNRIVMYLLRTYLRLS